MIARLIFGLVMLTVGTGAHAQAFISDGTAVGQAEMDVVEFGSDHRVVNSTIEYSRFEMANETHPLNQMSGPCFGVMEMRGGAVEGNGVCVLDGLEGDRVLLGWVARRVDPRGRVAGYWTVNAGTGSWLQASGGGTFLSEVNQANGAATNTIKGAITLR